MHGGLDKKPPNTKSSSNRSNEYVSRGGKLYDKRNDYCNYCKQFGHTIETCTHPLCKKSSVSKPSQNYSDFPKPQSSIGSQKSRGYSNQSSAVSSRDHSQTSKDRPIASVGGCQTDKNPFYSVTYKGTVSLHPNSEKYPINILLDTGASQTILLNPGTQTVL